MGKRIIVLSDGTGNSAAQVWRTNVWRMFESLDLKSSEQIAIYDDGVGSSAFKPLALLGGAFGFGLKRNVIGLYKFLCRNYNSAKDYEEFADQRTKSKSEDGVKNFSNDDIFLFGFSRGAFTVRLLSGLVLSQGLVNYSSEKDLDSKVRAAYRAYRTKRYPGWTLERLFRALRNLFASHTHDPAERPVDQIRFVGVWDTVAAYGTPIDEMTRGFSKYIWPLELPDHSFNSRRIVTARQALAIDEERTTFAPVLWDEDQSPLPDRTPGEPLIQVWFSGVHSNVGGGYPDDALAYVSLSWMMAEAAKCDLKFKTEPAADPDALKRAVAAQDKDGRLYDSRSGLGGYYRYGPRKIAGHYSAESIRPAVIHESVLSRVQMGAHLYAPIGLPRTYAVLDQKDLAIRALGSGTCETAESAAKRHTVQEAVWNVVWRRRAIYFLTVFASLYFVLYPLLRESFAYQEMATRLRIVADVVRLIGGFLPSAASRWPDGYARDPAWFLLWLATIGFLITYGSGLKSEINSRMRRIWNDNLPLVPRPPVAASASKALNVMWWTFLAFLVYVAIYPLFETSQLLQWLRLSDPWDSLLRTYSEQPIRFVIWAFLVFHFIPEQTIEWLRTLPIYQNVLTSLKFRWAPFFFAVAILYGAFASLSHLLFNVRDSFGSFCSHNTNENGPLNHGNDGFGNAGLISIPVYDSSLTDSRSLCFATGAFAKRGQKYAIGVRREPPTEKWSFWNEESFLSGQPVSHLAWWKQIAMVALFPFRRTLDRPWGATIVRYGPTGSEESFLDREPPALDDDLVHAQRYAPDQVPADKEVVGESWTATRDGEIYVYLNKPVLGLWGLETWISEHIIPNTGKAAIVIRKL